MTSHAIKGSDIFIRALENEGVEYIFGVPGEENLDMLESLCEPKTSSECDAAMESPKLAG